MRSGKSILLLAGAAAGVQLFASTAAAYPVARHGAEAAVTWEQEVLTVGDWLLDGETVGVSLTDRARNVRLTSGPDSGFLRLRVTSATDNRFLLLFRSGVSGRQPLRLRGYGLAVNTRKGDALFYRFDEGGVRNSGIRRDVPELLATDELEICLWYVGSTFVAVLFDGLTRKELATLTWSDPSYSTGSIGLQTAGRTATPARFHLSTLAQTTPAPGPRSWLSNAWLVTIDPAVVLTIPEPLRLKLRSTRSSPEGEAAFVANETTVTALRERGVPLLHSQPGVPFIYRYAGSFRQPAKIADTRRGIKYVEGLKPPELTLAYLRAFHRRFPELTRLEVLGQTVEGRDILALRIADDLDDTTRPTVLLVGAHHGGEAITPEMVLDAVRYILERPNDRRVRKWLSTFTLVAVPVVNVDGNHAFWHRSEQLGRTNRRPTMAEEPYTFGVDLNRNYPFLWGAANTRYNNGVEGSSFYRGPTPASEPETQAMMALCEREHFAGAISYHAAATKLLVPYSSGPQANPEPSAAWAVAREIEGRLRHRFGKKRYEAVRTLYEATGTDHNWMHNRFGTVALLLEAPVSVPVRIGQLRDAVFYSRPAWQHLLDRWIVGPSLSVRTLDESGQPIAATITLDEVTLSAGEAWTTRADNGWQHHYLPGPGSYTVRARTADRSAVAQLVVEEGVVKVELTLTRDSAELPAAQ